VTLVAASSNSKNVRDQLGDKMTKVEIAKKVGEIVAAEAKAKGIETVVFDRNQYRYHGRIKAVAEGARAGGLQL
jgi:large subunit ribosomal protein L18